jgi:hypothetical protein
MMAVLPDRFHHDQGRIRRQRAENFHPALLAIDESVAFLGVAGMSATNVAAFASDGLHDDLFGLRLRGPTSLVGAQT